MDFCVILREENLCGIVPQGSSEDKCLRRKWGAKTSPLSQDVSQNQDSGLSAFRGNSGIVREIKRKSKACRGELSDLGWGVHH